VKIIGAVGLNGSGKDELVNYLSRRCSIPVLSAGDIVRDIAQKEGILPTRDNLHDISQRYHSWCGDDFFMKKIIEKIEENQWNVAGVTGIRTPVDAATLRDHFGQDFILVYIEVSNPYVRYERTRKRGETRDPQKHEEFLIQDKTEEEIFKISETIKYADITIKNDDTLEAFHKRIEELIVQQRLSEENICR
jgi:dephospho-CoA kinase